MLFRQSLSLFEYTVDSRITRARVIRELLLMIPFRELFDRRVIRESLRVFRGGFAASNVFHFSKFCGFAASYSRILRGSRLRRELFDRRGIRKRLRTLKSKFRELFDRRVIRESTVEVAWLALGKHSRVSCNFLADQFAENRRTLLPQVMSTGSERRPWRLFSSLSYTNNDL